MKPKRTANSPPKMTASTTAARLSIGARLLPLAPSGYKRCVPFRRMLGELVARAPGARGAVFCDYEGEFVELVVGDPALSAYDMRVFGAQMAAVWSSLQNGSRERGAGGIVEMRLGCAGGTLLCRSLRDGYYVVLLVSPGAASGPAAFALRHAAAAMAAEL